MAERRSQVMNSVVRFWPLVVACSVLAAVVFAVVAGVRPATWTSAAEVLYGETPNAFTAGATSSGSDVQRVLATQADILTGDEVMDAAATSLGITTGELVTATSVEDRPGSNVLQISVSADSADDATRRAQAVADSYVEVTASQSRASFTRQADALQSNIDALREQLDAARSQTGGAETGAIATALAAAVQQQVQLASAADSDQGSASVITTAKKPASPSSPTPATGGALGAVVGLAIGTGVALLLSRSRSRRGNRRASPTPTAAMGAES